MSETFERYRRLLFTVAYELLGSAADAEDVVQDVWLRWSAADRGDIENPKAYLVRVATNLALSRLRSARARRERYVGPWLPEPLLTTPDVADEVEVSEAVSMALLVVLETLSPLERAVFVLQDVFGFPAREVADVLGRSEAAVRQLAHRAREHVQARRPRFDVDRRTSQAVTERFRDAVLTGDVETLIAMMSPGVLVTTDGGGKTRAALRPVSGPGNAARFLVAVARAGTSVPDLRLEQVDVNGAPALLAWSGPHPYVAVQVQLAGGRIDHVFIVSNPDKLASLTTPRTPSLR